MRSPPSVPAYLLPDGRATVRQAVEERQHDAGKEAAAAAAARQQVTHPRDCMINKPRDRAFSRAQWRTEVAAVDARLGELPGLHSAIAYVHHLIRQQIGLGQRADRIFVAGWSQGGFLALRAALAFPEAPLGGVFCVIAGAVTIAINKPKPRNVDKLQGIYCSFLTPSSISLTAGMRTPSW